MKVRLVAVGAAILLTIGACDNLTGPDAPIATETSTQTTDTASTSLPAGALDITSTTTGVANGAPVEVVDRLLEWAVVAGPEERLVPPAGIDETTLVFTVDGPVGDTIYVWQEGMAEASPLLSSETPYEVGAIDVSSGSMAALVAFVADGYSELRLWNRHGESTTVTRYDLAATPVDSFALDDDSVFFVMVTSDTSCVAEATMTGIEDADLYCATGDQKALGRVAVHESVVSVVDQDYGEECNRLITVDREIGEAAEVSLPQRDCLLHSGESNGSMAVWTNMPIADASGGIDYFDVSVVGFADSRKYDLGRGTAGSTTMCNGVAYWSGLSQAGSSEIRSWEPGEPVSVIYRSPDEGRGRRYATARPVCAYDRILVMRAGWQAGAPDEILVAPSVEWSVAIPLIEVSADPATYISALRESDLLADWTGANTDESLLQFGQEACAELDALPATDRVAHIYDPAIGTSWIERTGMTNINELAVWRQIAFRHLCASYYPLAVGD